MPRHYKATSTLHTAAQKAGKGSRPRQGARQRQAAGARAATPRDSGGRNARAAKRSRAIDIDNDANNMAGMCIAAVQRIPQAHFADPQTSPSSPFDAPKIQPGWRRGACCSNFDSRLLDSD